MHRARVDGAGWFRLHSLSASQRLAGARVNKATGFLTELVGAGFAAEVLVLSVVLDRGRGACRIHRHPAHWIAFASRRLALGAVPLMLRGAAFSRMLAFHDASFIGADGRDSIPLHSIGAMAVASLGGDRID
jgi:hypothetical protein